MSKERIYISGKMRGLDEKESRRRFADAVKMWRDLGFETVNPWDLEDAKKAQCEDWGDYILFDLPILKTCDYIYMLDNWEDSWGAKVEFNFAKGQGIYVYYEKSKEVITTMFKNRKR